MRRLGLCLLLLLSVNALAKPTDTILPLRERAQLVDSLIEKRVTTLLPTLMTETNIDMWLMISREYNEDPVLKTLLPSTWLQSARRTTMLVVVNNHDGSVATFAVAPYKVGNLFERAWDKKTEPDQYKALNALIAKYNPKNIGVNISSIWAHADGLSVTDHNDIMTKLAPQYAKRVVSAEPLAIRWLETRIPQEVELLRSMVAIAHQIIGEGFSAQTVTPGKTTTDDLVWWFRQRVAELTLDTWFHPSVSLQRADAKDFDHETTFTDGSADNVIRGGDLLHVDFGISYAQLHTDTQQHAYVLKQGERKVPAYLAKAFAKGNALQDIFTQEFAQGRTGNEVLLSSLQKAKNAGLDPTIYTHPLGFHGHAAGTTLGMWDQQGGVEGDGDYPLHEQTAYSIELNNAVYIEPWGKTIRIMLEEDAFFDQGKVEYLNGRQETIIPIGKH